MGAIMGVVYQVLTTMLVCRFVSYMLRDISGFYTTDQDVIPVFLNVMPEVYNCMVSAAFMKGLLGSLRPLRL